jgi:GTP-binding protein HflX
VSQGRGDEARLGEAVNLAEAIGLSVAHAEVTPVPRTRPSTLLGRGAVERLAHVIADAADEGAIAVVIVDAMLSPVQQRNLEKAWQCKVIDRTGVILEIFGARARTAEGRLQVESAALTYQRSRLVRSWTHLERQRGGFGFLGGPGESQLETDRRIIGDRIVRIGRELATVKRTRGLHRQARRRVPFPVVALVGYTNAGKSTLFNELTGAAVLVRDQLFATLDPTMRRLRLPSGRTVILSDTVGFLSDLPHELIEAFHATLEEVMEADLIVLVRDAADPETDQQRKDVLDVLEALGLGERLTDSVVEVLNKIDRLTEDDLVPLINRAERSTPPVIPLSAKTGQGCDQLLAALDARLATASRVLDLSLSHADGASLAWLYDHGQVLCRKDDRDAVYLSVRLDAADAERFARRAAAGRH